MLFVLMVLVIAFGLRAWRWARGDEPPAPKPTVPPARWDVPVLIAGALAALTNAGYVAIVSAEDNDSPAWWFVAGLVAAIVLLAYAARREVPGRTAALTLAGVDLLVLGFLGILSIGLPLLVAAVLALGRSGDGRRADAALGAAPVGSG